MKHHAFRIWRSAEKHSRTIFVTLSHGRKNGLRDNVVMINAHDPSVNSLY